jgi:hypothetical protein
VLGAGCCADAGDWLSPVEGAGLGEREAGGGDVLGPRRSGPE